MKQRALSTLNSLENRKVFWIRHRCVRLSCFHIQCKRILFYRQTIHPLGKVFLLDGQRSNLSSPHHAFSLIWRNTLFLPHIWQYISQERLANADISTPRAKTCCCAGSSLLADSSTSRSLQSIATPTCPVNCQVRPYTSGMSFRANAALRELADVPISFVCIVI